MHIHSIYAISEQAICLSLGNTMSVSIHEHLLRTKAALEQKRFPGLLDIIIGYTTLTIRFDYYQLAKHRQEPAVFDFVSKQMEDAYQMAISMKHVGKKSLRVPVCYDAPFAIDMDDVKQLTDLTSDRIISLHTSKTYQVFMIGFLPGFPYLGETDSHLNVPRKVTPRKTLQPGSVGLAGRQTGIYPVVSPGGWQIIGRTPMKFFDPDRNPPVPLQPGDTVEFYSISTEEFENFVNT